MAEPSRRPIGAITATAISTRIANGCWISAESIGARPNAATTSNATAVAERGAERSLRQADPRREEGADAGEREEREEHNRERVRGEPEEQHEALDEHDLDQQIPQSDRHEVRERRRARRLPRSAHEDEREQERRQRAQQQDAERHEQDRDRVVLRQRRAAD